MAADFDVSTKRAIERTEQHLARLANYFCPAYLGDPSPFEEALARQADRIIAAAKRPDLIISGKTQTLPVWPTGDGQQGSD